MYKRGLLLVLAVSLAGCSGIVGGPSVETPDAPVDQLRLVIENDLSTTQSVAVNLTTTDGQTVLNKSQQIQAGGKWVVTTINTTSRNETIQYMVRLPGLNRTAQVTPVRPSNRGARVNIITDDGIGIFECTGNLTCWEGRQNF